jgi:hypothetical protein
LVAEYPAICLWYSNYSQVPSNLDCQLHHCSHPYKGESSYTPPPLENQLNLDLSQSINDSIIPLGSNISYSCAPGTFIESAQSDPTHTKVKKTAMKKNYCC